MARKIIVVEKEEVFCDHCGKKLTEEDVQSFSLIARGVCSWDMKEGILFEGGFTGDYCNHCLMLLQNKILEWIGDLLHERYDSVEEEEKPDKKIWDLIEKESVDV